MPALASVLPQYDIVVVADADAIFRHLYLPYEFLLNRWGITPQTSFAMPLDVAWDTKSNTSLGYTNNRFGEVNPNNGFITALNLPRTFEMLHAWNDCPDEPNRFPGCDRFRGHWPADQGAFGEYIRYEFGRSTDFHAFSCDDAVGFPWQDSECRGVFIRHFTTWKDGVKGGVADSVLTPILGMAQQGILGSMVDRTSNEMWTTVGSEREIGRSRKSWMTWWS